MLRHSKRLSFKVFTILIRLSVVGNSKNKLLILCCADEEIELSTDNIKEQRFMATSSAVDIPVEQLKTSCRKLDNTEITRNDLCCAGDVSDLSLDTVRDGHLKISQFSLDRNFAGNQKNKLLILDLNGLLADFVSISDTDTPFRRYRREPEPDFVLRGKKGDMVKCLVSSFQISYLALAQIWLICYSFLLQSTRGPFVTIFYSFALTHFMWEYGRLDPSICQSVTDFISLFLFISLT